jgi:hypothetical protein
MNNEKTPYHLPDIQAVVKYLEKSGYCITQSTLYRHCREGKICRDFDGTFSNKAVSKYAKYFLKARDGSRFVSSKSARAHIEKLRVEMANILIQNARDFCHVVGGDITKVPDLLAVVYAWLDPVGSKELDEKSR